MIQYPNIFKRRETGNVFANEYVFVRDESCQGKNYTLKGLYNFLRTPEVNSSVIAISQDVQKDLARYKELRERRKNSRTKKPNTKTLEARV